MVTWKVTGQSLLFELEELLCHCVDKDIKGKRVEGNLLSLKSKEEVFGGFFLFFSNFVLSTKRLILFNNVLDPSV